MKHGLFFKRHLNLKPLGLEGGTGMKIEQKSIDLAETVRMNILAIFPRSRVRGRRNLTHKKSRNYA